MKNVKRRLYLYIVLLGGTLITMLLLRGYTRDSSREDAQSVSYRDLAEIQHEGILRVVAPYNFVPLDSLKTSGKSSLPFIQELARQLKVQVELVLEDNTAKAIQMLKENRVDLVLSLVERTSDIDSVSLVWLNDNVSEPIYLVQRKDTTLSIRKHSDLNEVRITLPQNSTLKLFVSHLSDELGLNIYVDEDTIYNTEQLITLVNSGKIQYTICRGEDVQRYQAYFPNLDFSIPLSHSLRRGWLLRSSSPTLRDSLELYLR